MSTIVTAYSPGDTVFIIYGSDEKARVVESTIQSFTTVCSINNTVTMYDCQLSRSDLGIEMNGSPDMFTVKRTEPNMFDTLEKCLNEIIIRKNKSQKK